MNIKPIKWSNPQLINEEPRIGVFVCHCGLNIAGVISPKELCEYSKSLPNVIFVKDNRYTCSDPGQDEIRKAIKEHKLNRVVVAACSPRLHEPTFRKCVSEAGLNPYIFEMANIREFSSWCHSREPEEATKKAKDIIKVAVAKARLLQPLEIIKVPVTNKALVIGGGIAGINAALDLAEMGFKVYLLEKGESIGGRMAQLDKTFPTLDCSICMPGDEEIILGDGSLISMENLAKSLLKNPEMDLKTLDVYGFSDWKLKSGRIIKVYKVPAPNRLIEVRTSMGAKVRFTPDHPILIDSKNGPAWMRCEQLKLGDRVYAPRKIILDKPSIYWIVDLLSYDIKIADEDLLKELKARLRKRFGSLMKAAKILNLNYRNLGKGRFLSIREIKGICHAVELDWDFIKRRIHHLTYRGAGKKMRIVSQVLDENLMYLLGLLASNGSLKGKEIRFCNTNEKLIELFIELYKKYFSNRSYGKWFIEPEGGARGVGTIIQVKNKVLMQIATSLDIKGRLAPILKLRESTISAFLRGVFDGDGCIRFKDEGGCTLVKINFDLGKDDYEFAYGLHLLLKRLGIISKVYELNERIIVDISNKLDVLKFIESVGSDHPEKRKVFEEAVKICEDKRVKESLFDELPLKCGLLIGNLLRRYNLQISKLSLTATNVRRIIKQECRITLDNLSRMIEFLEGSIKSDDPDLIELKCMYNSDFFLDKVREVREIPCDCDYVYDVTVDGIHNFIPKGTFVVSNCIEGPRMVDVSRHPNIEIISYADLVSVSGYVGNFRVKIRKRPRYIIVDNCTGCGECRDVCPIEYPNEWDLSLGVRKAISVPFDQAVPLVYTINRDYCIECYKCVEACGARQAIDFNQQSEELELDVGAIIVATGYDIYLPYDDSLYGYGKYDNVITGLELERLLLAAGPTGGKVVRASDGEKPHSIAFIQCVGSRDVNKYEYCSGICCMYTLKHVVMLKEKYRDEIEAYVLFMDMRTHFKGYEEFYRRARELGAIFIRGRVSKLEEVPETKDLIIRAEDMALGMPIEIKAEMVVLQTAAVPKADSADLARILGIPRGTDGFFMESHPKLKPIDTAMDGIFLAGSCQGPKDIPYSVAQGSAAAARAATILSKKEWAIEPIVAIVDKASCRNTKVKCGVCAEKCPYGAIKVEPGEPAFVVAAMCHGCGTCAAECPADAITQMHFTDAQILSQIRASLEEGADDKILAFLCNWCSYAGADLAGTSRFEYPPTVRPIRVMCSGRVDRDFVLEAFRLGVGMVLVAACHLPYDCHYISGNWKMKARMESLHGMLVKLGMSPERLRIDYVSAAEGLKFAGIIKEMNDQMKALGKGRIKAENDKLKPYIERMLVRKKV